MGNGTNMVWIISNEDVINVAGNPTWGFLSFTKARQTKKQLSVAPFTLSHDLEWTHLLSPTWNCSAVHYPKAHREENSTTFAPST